uniref:Cupin type-1 domain-containing protein n=1 Tax=Fagus sylvatica TaxID=28930 RepID=A0A2N9GNW0_FAGSY
MTRAYFVIVALFVLAFSFAFASDPSPLQDFCVALKNSSDSAVFVNGKICKDPKLAKADDFYFGGLNIAGNTENIFGANFTPVTVDQIPGLNTLGISVARVDYAPKGQTPPHTHTTKNVTCWGGFSRGGLVKRLYRHLLRRFF